MLQKLDIFEQIALEGKVLEEHYDDLKTKIASMANALLKTSPEYVREDAIDQATSDLWEYTSKKRSFSPGYCFSVVKNALVAYAERERKCKYLRPDYQPIQRAHVSAETYLVWFGHCVTDQECNFVRNVLETDLGGNSRTRVCELANEAGIDPSRAFQLLEEISTAYDIRPRKAAF